MSTAVPLDAAGRLPVACDIARSSRRAAPNKGRGTRLFRRRSRRSSRSCARPARRSTRTAPRALIVVLWRAGLRIGEALALTETDLDPQRGSILVRRGKGGKRRTVGMDAWAWEQIGPWLDDRLAFPPGAVFCVIARSDRRRAVLAAAVRSQLRRLATQAGVRRRFAPTSCDTPTP